MARRALGGFLLSAVALACGSHAPNPPGPAADGWDGAADSGQLTDAPDVQPLRPATIQDAAEPATFPDAALLDAGTPDADIQDAALPEDSGNTKPPPQTDSGPTGFAACQAGFCASPDSYYGAVRCGPQAQEDYKGICGTSQPLVCDSACPGVDQCQGSGRKGTCGHACMTTDAALAACKASAPSPLSAPAGWAVYNTDCGPYNPAHTNPWRLVQGKADYRVSWGFCEWRPTLSLWCCP